MRVTSTLIGIVTFDFIHLIFHGLQVATPSLKIGRWRGKKILKNLPGGGFDGDARTL